MSFTCTRCLEDRSDGALAYYEGTDTELCVDCASPEYLAQVKRRKEQDAAIGHTGDSMCGCERCAERFEREGY